MSVSDSEQNTQGGEYKFFRPYSRHRILYEMLGSTRSEGRSSWKVLIMDKLTLKVLSHCCKMAELTDHGVSLVEDLFKRRQPLTSMEAIYFIQPSKENMIMFLSDMSGREPLYKKAYIFFSRPAPKDLINHIKCDSSVCPRIGALREMNLEYFPIESQAYITDQDSAMGELFSEEAEKTRRFEDCLNTMATRIATVFASMKELPFVRYRGVNTEDASTSKACDLIPSKLAEAVWNCLLKYKAIPSFPQTETCELLILNRSFDKVAPVIHEWTYDAMCHDLLDLDGNKYVTEVPSKTGGPPEKKEVLLEEHDPVWLELRHAHIADASERLHDKFTTFKSKNKAAQIPRDGSEMSTRDLQKIVQAMPQYNETMERLSLHVEIAGKINSLIRNLGLRDLGQVEQDLVFGDAGPKELMNYLRANQDSPPENKLRLLMIFALACPDNFEGDKATKLMQLANLSPEDMKLINNMKLLGGQTKNKKATTGFSLKFDGGKKSANHALRKDRATGEEETWALFRFYPMLEEIIENLIKGELPKDEFICVNEASKPVQDKSDSQTKVAPTAPARPGQSRRSRRTVNYARAHAPEDGYSSDSVLKGAATPDLKRMGKRIFVFIVGGATRSELRACHKLTTKLQREVILGSTWFDDPPQYLTKLKLLSETDLSVGNPQPQFW